MTYMFRLPFNLPDTQRIGVPEVELVLSEHGDRRVILQSDSGASIGETGRLSVRGWGYETADGALEDCRRWRNAIAIGLLQLRVGVDFGDRVPLWEMNADALAQIGAEVGARLVPDVPGATVLKDLGQTTYYARVDAAAIVTTGSLDGPALIRAAHDSHAALDDVTLLALDLYGAHHRLPLGDAQFLTLMMAVEAFIESNPLSADVAAAVYQLLDFAAGLDIAADARDSVLGRIRELSRESILQAGRRLMGTLGDRNYAGMSARKFFNECYKIRSSLVHAAVERPSASKVQEAVGPLVAMVEDLIRARIDVSESVS